LVLPLAKQNAEASSRHPHYPMQTPLFPPYSGTPPTLSALSAQQIHKSPAKSDMQPVPELHSVSLAAAAETTTLQTNSYACNHSTAVNNLPDQETQRTVADPDHAVDHGSTDSQATVSAIRTRQCKQQATETVLGQ
jgi:hypothetical protein